MNMRSLSIVLGALTAFALGACTVESTSTTSTGSGGSTGATGATGTATGTGGEGTGGSASTGTAMCDPEYTCAMAITTPDGNPAELCEGTEAQKAFDALSSCTCTGACATACADSSCKQMEASTDCKACLADTAAGCGNEFVTCANN